MSHQTVVVVFIRNAGEAAASLETDRLVSSRLVEIDKFLRLPTRRRRRALLPRVVTDSDGRILSTLPTHVRHLIIQGSTRHGTAAAAAQFSSGLGNMRLVLLLRVALSAKQRTHKKIIMCASYMTTKKKMER